MNTIDFPMSALTANIFTWNHYMVIMIEQNWKINDRIGLLLETNNELILKHEQLTLVNASTNNLSISKQFKAIIMNYEKIYGRLLNFVHTKHMKENCSSDN